VGIFVLAVVIACSPRSSECNLLIRRARDPREPRSFFSPAGRGPARPQGATPATPLRGVGASRARPAVPGSGKPPKSGKTPKLAKKGPKWGIPAKKAEKAIFGHFRAFLGNFGISAPGNRGAPSGDLGPQGSPGGAPGHPRRVPGRSLSRRGMTVDSGDIRLSCCYCVFPQI